MFNNNYDLYQTRDEQMKALDDFFPEDELECIRYKVLVSSLATLADARCSQDMREEIMSWLDSDEVEDAITGTPLPFSFVNVVVEQGLIPGIFRDLIHDFLKRHQFLSFEDTRDSIEYKIDRAINNLKNSKMDDLFGFEGFAA
ncbi:hypothetical protein [uncultured Umboniibacter sp.]|uniref:hypothetical protein n=1 Tax=uncultured Umboniibacter sp. TaxID=1798917 RepID=UPI002621FB7E|nr:hypothetical protein [uncultured Umboniibacter sp.]